MGSKWAHLPCFKWYFKTSSHKKFGQFRGVEPPKSGGLRVGLVPLESRFEPCSPRYSPFLVLGCMQPMCTECGAFGGLFLPFLGHMVEVEGTKGLFDTLLLAVLNGFRRCFGLKMAVFAPTCTDFGGHLLTAAWAQGRYR